jgi:hypothetical protein
MRGAGVFVGGEPHSGRAKAAGAAAAFRREERRSWGLSGRQLPQHMNESEFVHGGSVATKLSVQRVDVHARRMNLRAPARHAARRCVVVR